MRPGPRNLITDVAGLTVGNAADARLKSGVTVLAGAAPFVAAVDVRGGAPGTRETDLLEPGTLVAGVDALVLSGGSAFGLDAAAGVMEALAAAGRGFAVRGLRVPIVPAAILFDLDNGGEKDWQANPYRALGAAALAAARVDFTLGTEGAGTGALTARVKGGLGSASAVIEGGYTVGALVAANPVGCATIPGSRAFWAWPWEKGGEFGDIAPPRGRDGAEGAVKPLGTPGEARANTTIAIVATDAPLDKAGARRLAMAAQDGLARAIVPAHTPRDGDLVFGVSTGSGAVPGLPVLEALGRAAASVLARAVARGVYHATAAPGDRLPPWSALR